VCAACEYLTKPISAVCDKLNSSENRFVQVSVATSQVNQSINHTCQAVPFAYTLFGRPASRARRANFSPHSNWQPQIAEQARAAQVATFQGTTNVYPTLHLLFMIKAQIIPVYELETFCIQRLFQSLAP
jgi:hypothetical protein